MAISQHPTTFTTTTTGDCHHARSVLHGGRIGKLGRLLLVRDPLAADVVGAVPVGLSGVEVHVRELLREDPRQETLRLVLPFAVDLPQ